MSGGPRRRFRLVAVLYATLFFNAALLELNSYQLLTASQLGPFSVPVLLAAIFLGLGVFYVPARLGQPLGWLAEACLGRVAGGFVSRFLLPAWLLTWCGFVSELGVRCLRYSLFPETPSFPNENPFLLGCALLIWFCVIVVASRASPTSFSQTAVLPLKLSVVVFVGLAISSRPWESNSLGWVVFSDSDPYVRLLNSIVLWGGPPILFVGNWLGPPPNEGRSYPASVVLESMALGVVLPVILAFLLGGLTVVGATGISNLYWKLPSYLGYAAARISHLGWVKLLLMTFTLLMAARFAANLAVMQVVRARNWATTSAVVAILTLPVIFLDSGLVWGAWCVPATLFLPLAGVFTSAYLIRGADLTLPATARHVALCAWISGSAVACIPLGARWTPLLVVSEHSWPLAGWLTALLFMYAGRSKVAEPSAATGGHTRDDQSE